MSTQYDRTDSSDAPSGASSAGATPHRETDRPQPTPNGNGFDLKRRSPEIGLGPTLEQLKERLAEDRITRLALMFLDRYEGMHLKDQPVSNMDAQRYMELAGHRVVNFGSDSFLGLDQHPAVKQAIVDGLAEWGTHNGASRAFTSAAICDQAERRIADWLDVDDTLIFPSVTLANVGLLPALAGKNDLLVVDRQSHDSLHQAARIAAGNGARVVEMPECTGPELERVLAEDDCDNQVVAVDGVYSMTGVVPPLKELYDVTRRHGAVLYIDDAHATGMIGPRGHGAAKVALGSLRDVLMVGSLSKAFSCLGAFVTCDSRLKRLLKIRSSSFIFGGPVPPPYLNAVCAVCDILESPAYPPMMRHLRALIDRLVVGVQAMGLRTFGGEAGILAITVGDIEQTLLAGKFLFDRGYYVQSATYPAVPVMGGILRVQVNANHSVEQVDGLLDAIRQLGEAFDLPTA